MEQVFGRNLEYVSERVQAFIRDYLDISFLEQLPSSAREAKTERCGGGLDRFEGVTLPRSIQSRIQEQINLAGEFLRPAQRLLLIRPPSTNGAGSCRIAAPGRGLFSLRPRRGAHTLEVDGVHMSLDDRPQIVGAGDVQGP